MAARLIDADDERNPEYNNEDLINTTTQTMTPFPRNANWSFSKHLKGIKFDGIYQYQHLIIEINTAASAPSQVSVRELVDPASLEPVNSIDINITNIRFQRLATYIKTKVDNMAQYSEATHIIRYVYPSEPDVNFRIYDDESLRAALTVLRVEKSYSVSIPSDSA
jgi:hypothetical protein